jgi:type VI secretion system Hcp family effector
MSAAFFRRLCLLGVLAFSLPASPAEAGLKFYMQIPTIAGGATTQNHSGWIEMLGFGAVLEEGTAMNPPRLPPVSISKLLDKASPNLAYAVPAGTALGDVTLDMVDEVNGLPIYRVLLRRAFVSSHTLAGSAGGDAIENLVLVYAAIEWSYTQTSSGIEFTWHWDQTDPGSSGPGLLPPPFTEPQTDSDGDGIPDVYEFANGLNPFANDAALDLDGDGASNGSEYLAGTRANDAKSVFRVHGISRENGTMLITWSSAPNRRYTIRKSVKPNGPWTDVQSGIPSQGEGETARTIPISAANLFFQVNARQ